MLGQCVKNSTKKKNTKNKLQTKDMLANWQQKEMNKIEMSCVYEVQATKLTKQNNYPLGIENERNDKDWLVHVEADPPQ